MQWRPCQTRGAGQASRRQTVLRVGKPKLKGSGKKLTESKGHETNQRIFLILELRLLGPLLPGRFGQFRHENDSCSRGQYLDSGNFAMNYYSPVNDNASDLCILIYDL